MIFDWEEIKKWLIHSPVGGYFLAGLVGFMLGAVVFWG